MATRRIAIAGLGAGARWIHLPAYAKTPGLEVVAGCDPDPGVGPFPFPVFDDVTRMLRDTRPDVLAVVTPPGTHYEPARAGLLAGCHVFCEKPFMEDLREAAEIIALAKCVGRWVVVNNQYRFMNIHWETKRLIGGPEFGDLLFASVEQTVWSSDPEGWRTQSPRRTCREFGTHVLDLCRFFFDEDPVSVTARMPRPGRRDAPDDLDLIDLEFSGDRIARVTLDRLCRGRHRYLQIRLDGSEGCVETRLGGGARLSAGVRGGSRTPFFDLDVSPGGRARLYHGERYRKVAADPIDVFASASARLLGAFFDALDRGETPPCHAEDNCRTLALMLAAYESHETGRTIRVTDRLREPSLRWAG